MQEVQRDQAAWLVASAKEVKEDKNGRMELAMRVSLTYPRGESEEWSGQPLNCSRLGVTIAYRLQFKELGGKG